MIHKQQNGLGGLLARRARANPDREAYVDSLTGFRLTYAQLNQRCNRAAGALAEIGVKRCDRVAILMMNGHVFIETFVAIAKLGAIAVPLNWRLTPTELEFIIRDSGAKTLVFGSGFQASAISLYQEKNTHLQHWIEVSEAPEAGTAIVEFAKPYEALCATAKEYEPQVEIVDDDLLYIMYTSGTTGLPKGVVHTHGSSIWALLTIIMTTDMQATDRFLIALPMFHVGALTPVALSIYLGGTSVVMRSFDPVQAWQAIEKEKITTGILVPAMLNFMLQVGDLSRFDYRSVRWMMSGASPVPVSLIRKYMELGIEIHQIYGLTESCGPACLVTGENAILKIGSTGKAFFHTDVKIVDADGGDCPPGDPGEVLVSGPHVMKEYWNNPQATAKTIVDGWLHTGDMAVQDEEGFVYIKDRLKDMVISGGENIYPAEIENVLLTHPDIRDAAVIGQPSERWGESPFAVIVAGRESLSEAEVLDFCVDKLASFKHPKGVAFVSELPRNPSGKVLKRLLRKQFPGPASI